MDGIADRLTRRYSKRALARAVVVLLAVVLASQLLLVWYFGSVGLSLREMGYDEDDRTVLIDREDYRTFAHDYHPEREEGWCLYGAANASTIRIDDVVHAQPLRQGAEHVEFTCVRETVRQFVEAENTRLVGTAHSHPSKHRSRLSRVDTMTWGRTSPVVEVMGIYTKSDGIEFFTVSSMLRPLDTEVTGDSSGSTRLSVGP